MPSHGEPFLDIARSFSESGDLVDGAVVSAVLDVLLDSGPDAVHLSGIAESTGHSLEEFTEEFGHVGELLHLVWEQLLRVEFASIVVQAQQVTFGRLEALNDARTVSRTRRAAVHILVVAHRFDELKESLPFDVQRILYAHESDCVDDCDRWTLRAVVAWLCGVSLDPGRDPADTLLLLPDIAWHAGCWRESAQDHVREETPEMPLEFDRVGEMHQNILLACTRIVAEGGVGRATLIRIARAVGYPPSVVYGMYGRQEHLLAHYVQIVFSTLFSYRRLAELLQDAAHADMRLRVWLGARVQMRRRAVLECVLASGFSPFLKGAYVDALDEGLADVRVAHVHASSQRTLNTQRRFIASRQIALGLAVLAEVELDPRTPQLSHFLSAFLSDRN